MEKFRKEIKTERSMCAIYMGTLVCFMGANGIFWGRTAEHISSFIHGFGIGLALAILGVMFGKTVKGNRLLKNEEELKKEYIARTDERNKKIEAESGGVYGMLVVWGLLLATVIAGYFNGIVFFSLLGASVFAIVAKIIMKIRAKEKY